jgi:hypothetical protein
MISIANQLTWIDNTIIWNHYVGCGSTADERKKVDCSMKCTSKLIYMRDMNIHVSV